MQSAGKPALEPGDCRSLPRPLLFVARMADSVEPRRPANGPPTAHAPGATRCCTSPPRRVLAEGRLLGTQIQDDVGGQRRAADAAARCARGTPCSGFVSKAAGQHAGAARLLPRAAEGARLGAGPHHMSSGWRPALPHAGAGALVSFATASLAFFRRPSCWPSRYAGTRQSVSTGARRGESAEWGGNER